MLPAAVHVNAPVGINTIVPPPAEIGAGAVIVTIAAVPLINVIGLVGAIVVALAIVGAAAVVASSPEYLMFVNVGLPVQLSNTPLAGVPKTGAVNTMPDDVHAEITPLATVPNAGVTNVGDVANTSAPDPVSPVTAAAKLVLDGVAKNVATPDPKPETPVDTGSPVQLVRVPEAGVPNAGATKVLFLHKSSTEICLVTLLCTKGTLSAPVAEVAAGNCSMVTEVILILNSYQQKCCSVDECLQCCKASS